MPRDGPDISSIIDFTKYLIPGQTVGSFINHEEKITWSVYPERGSNEGYYVNIELIQGMHSRCPIAGLRVHNESVNSLFEVMEKIISYLEQVDPRDMFLANPVELKNIIGKIKCTS